MKTHTLIFLSAALALLILAGWLLGPQTPTDAQLSSGRWTMQSAGPQSSMIFMYNTNTGDAYQVLFGQNCDEYPIGTDACLVRVRRQ